MFKSALLIATLMSLGFSSYSAAQVERSQLTETIEQQEPVSDLGNTVTVRAGELKKVFFFTQISHLANQQITHRWIYQGSEKAAVTLNIGSENWRTYSSKILPSYWPGEWQVQVWYGDLQLLRHDFTVVIEP
ncbi:DUF2914 domain-containing protein [Paraglaciecola sp.]|uniref:DUF2914 domain-containing protein n=1 Tax=Paraglaciecola sp. TaxID=1920173 RepID=UPI0030F47E10